MFNKTVRTLDLYVQYSCLLYPIACRMPFHSKVILRMGRATEGLQRQPPGIGNLSRGQVLYPTIERADRTIWAVTAGLRMAVLFLNTPRTSFSLLISFDMQRED